MTSLEMIFVPIAFMFSPISISEGGGVHQPEPKCHFDLRFQPFHSWGGGGGVHCLPILRLNMNAKESIVFMFKVHLPHTQATGNCAISL